MLDERLTGLQSFFRDQREEYESLFTHTCKIDRPELVVDVHEEENYSRLESRMMRNPPPENVHLER